MKTLIPLLCLLLPVFIAAQDIEKHARVALQLDRPELVNYLNDNGFAIDHFHKHEKDKIEVIITHSELNRLEGLGVAHEVLIRDVTAHFLETAGQASARNADCGLVNFDAGDMNSYHTYDNMQAHINTMQSLFPGLVQISEIGNSVEGRTIFAVKISDNVSQDESDSEGVVYYDALTHAREPMGLETVLYYMWTLLESYGSDPEYTYLVNNRELYFVPVVNPDGYVYNQTTNPNGGGLWRKNRRDNGNSCFGIDLNRNFAYGWGNNAGSSGDPCSGTYRGTEAFSEPETQAVRDFTAMIQPAAAFSCHTYSDVFLCPNGFDDNLVNYETYAEFASEFIPANYKGYGNWIQMIHYYGAGTTHDYLNSQDAIAYTPEIGHTFWEIPSVICDRIQEMLPAMKYLSWVAGDYACFHDFKLVDDEPVTGGSTNAMIIRLKNRGLSQIAQNVQVVLDALHPSFGSVGSNIYDYGDILSRQFADNASEPFLFTSESELIPGEEVPFKVTVLQNGAISYVDTIYIYAGDREVLFQEDGENGMTEWETSAGNPWDTTFMDAFNGEHCIADTRYGNFSANVQNFIQMVDAVDLTATTSPWLEFSAKWSLEPGGDYVRPMISTDGGLSWLALEGKYTEVINSDYAYSGNRHWVQERIDLSFFQTFSNVRIGFIITTDSGVQGDGFYFDDLRIVDYFEPDMTDVEGPELRDTGFELFPNPAGDVLHIRCEDCDRTVEMVMLDIQGRIVLSEQFSGEGTALSLTALPNGVYWLRFLTDDRSEMKKLVVVK